MSEQQLWNQIKETLQKKLPGKLLGPVLNTVTLESSFSSGQKHFTLKVPSLFHQEILKKHFSHIQSQIQTQGGSLKITGIKKTSLSPARRKIQSPPPRPPYSSQPQKNSAFFTKWTFPSFIQGPNNCFALSLAQSVAKKPVKNSSNPLFIYGPSGLGKTHLLHAIGNKLEKEAPQLKVLYLPAERFFNDCINHIRTGNMPAFRQKYRQNIHVLLLDDIQILGKGESIQEEFFHTFENLKQSGCQIVLVSDQKPKNIKGLKSRIQTRFEGGVVADIQAPDKDTKKAIIKNKSHINLSEDIISYITELPSTSIRELEGYLNKIKMFCELQNKTPSLPIAQQLFSEEKNLPPEKDFSRPFPPTKNPKVKDILKKVCTRFGIKGSELKSPSRLQHITLARNTAIYLIRTELNLSLVEIGRLLGNRNHSTVLNSLKTVERQQKKNQRIAKDIQELRTIIHK